MLLASVVQPAHTYRVLVSRYRWRTNKFAKVLRRTYTH